MPDIARSPERRPITVLFCDIVGWSSRARHVDPEDLADLLVGYRRRCADIVARHDGIIMQFVGDGVMAVFGYPHAHEDDAERAVRAALDLLTPESSTPSLFEVHIGIATDAVVIGNLPDPSSSRVAGDGSAQSSLSAVGDALNLAARLQTLAQPGTIVVSDQTRRVCGGMFEFSDLGQHELRNVGTERAWRVVRESRVESRYHARRAAGLTPLVNRRGELHEIEDLWRSVKQGHGTTVLVMGDAGIGKSRLVDEASERLVRDGALRVSCFCSSTLQSSPLAPVLRHLSRAAGFEEADDEQARLQKLQQMVAASSLDANEVVPLLATMLSLPYETAYPALALSPQRQRQRLFEVFVTMLKDAARQRPVLLVVEDLHWIDPSSDELLQIVVEAIRDWPVLTIVTTRTPAPKSWEGRPHVRNMRVQALDQSDSLEMIEWLCRNQSVQDGAATTIAERAGGLPLFIEDLTRHVLDSATEPAGTRARRAGASVAIPDTLTGALTSRLDRLGLAAKQIAEIGSVIGREFPLPLLTRVAALPEDELAERIRRLVDSGLVTARHTSAAVCYEFKHALVRDAAYAGLLQRNRKTIHARIADALVAGDPHVADEQPELLAHHLQAAGQTDRAITQWISAAKLSARRSGFAEAIALLARALRLCRMLDAREDRWRQRLRVYLAAGGIYTEYRGFASRKCSRNYALALETCRQLGTPPQIFAALSGVGSVEITRGNLARSKALGEECLELARTQETEPPFVMAHLLLGGTAFLTGQFSDSRRHLDEAISRYESERQSRLGRQRLYVQDQKSTGLCYLGLGLTIMGHLDAGVAASTEGVRHARELGALHAMNFSLCYLAGVYNFRRDHVEALRFATESLDLTYEQGFVTWRGASRIVRGDALMGLGSVAEGFAEIQAGVDAHHDIDNVSYRTFSLGVRARGLLLLGRPEEALSSIEEGLSACAARDERFYLAELLRVKGVALATKGMEDEAERWLREAIAVATRQEAMLFRLRSAVSLCQLRENAVETVTTELLPAYTWFDQGITSPDLAEARAIVAAALNT